MAASTKKRVKKTTATKTNKKSCAKKSAVAKKNVKTVSRSQAATTKKKVVRSRKALIDQTTFTEYVQTRAYYLWQEAGHPDSGAHERWVQAEQEVLTKYAVK